MEAPVKKVWLAQLAFPAIQYGVLMLIAYVKVYWFEDYDRKFDKAGAFEIYLYLIALITAISSLLYAITFLLKINSIMAQARTMPLTRLLLPIAVCALIQVGVFFPIQQFGINVILLWLFLVPPTLALLSIKFIADEQQPDFE